VYEGLAEGIHKQCSKPSVINLSSTTHQRSQRNTTRAHERKPETVVKTRTGDEHGASCLTC
jgi:hypothetical protein